MENSTKALLMAGGVLIAIIIISIAVITFQRTGSVSQGYDATIRTEEITIFNSNFTKYIGQDLTIHDVVTICNFAYNNNVHKVKVNNSDSQPYTTREINIHIDIDKTFKITNIIYDNETGYIKSIRIH